MLELWYQALGSPCGICVETDNFKQTRQKLYMARHESGDVDLEGLSVVQSPTNPNQIWIVKNGKGK